MKDCYIVQDIITIQPGRYNLGKAQSGEGLLRGGFEKPATRKAAIK